MVHAPIKWVGATVQSSFGACRARNEIMFAMQQHDATGNIAGDPATLRSAELCHRVGRNSVFNARSVLQCATPGIPVPITVWKTLLLHRSIPSSESVSAINSVQVHAFKPKGSFGRHSAVISKGRIASRNSSRASTARKPPRAMHASGFREIALSATCHDRGLPRAA